MSNPRQLYWDTTCFICFLSAVIKKVDALQKWDRDFDCMKALVQVEEPSMMSVQQRLDLPPIGPTPDDFKALPVATIPGVVEEGLAEPEPRKKE